MHTFLVREGTWQARGEATSPDGQAHPLEGASVITHSAGLWTNASWMQLPDGSRYENVYQVVPFFDGRKMTSWTSVHAVLGRQLGHLVEVGDALLLTSVTEDGAHASAESLHQAGDDLYQGRGCLYRGDQFISSWAVELRRIK